VALVSFVSLYVARRLVNEAKVMPLYLAIFKYLQTMQLTLHLSNTVCSILLVENFKIFVLLVHIQVHNFQLV